VEENPDPEADADAADALKELLLPFDPIWIESLKAAANFASSWYSCSNPLLPNPLPALLLLLE
jgi:hypothetical protein